MMVTLDRFDLTLVQAAEDQRGEVDEHRANRNRLNIANKLIRLFVRRQKFLNALPDRSAFVLFHVDKIRLSREMATNIQSFGSED